MATCSMGFEHGDPEPEVIPVPVDTGPNENDVRIAEIEAAASVKREQIWTEQQALALEAEREELRGELRGMREVLDRLVPPAPEPDTTVPEPVIVAPPADIPEDVPAPGDNAKPPAKKDSGFWAGYASS